LGGAGVLDQPPGIRVGEDAECMGLDTIPQDRGGVLKVHLKLALANRGGSGKNPSPELSLILAMETEGARRNYLIVLETIVDADNLARDFYRGSARPKLADIFEDDQCILENSHDPNLP
jgi:hypothetical protein